MAFSSLNYCPCKSIKIFPKKNRDKLIFFLVPCIHNLRAVTTLHSPAHREHLWSQEVIGTSAALPCSPSRTPQSGHTFSSEAPAHKPIHKNHKLCFASPSKAAVTEEARSCALSSSSNRVPVTNFPREQEPLTGRAHSRVSAAGVPRCESRRAIIRRDNIQPRGVKQGAGISNLPFPFK